MTAPRRRADPPPASPRPLLLIVALLLAGILVAWLWPQSERAPVEAPAPPRQETSKAPPPPTDAVKGVDAVPLPPPAPPSVDPQAAAARAICASGGTDFAGQSKLYGHLRQPQASMASLTPPAFGAGAGNCTLIEADAGTALGEMIAAARTEGAPGLFALSCFRSHARQSDLYCKGAQLGARGYAGQARWVAPPGFSEHATGRAVDFADNSNRGCDLSECFESTAGGRWLAANARRFGFAMSFPRGNSQGVSYEPWHFRYRGGYRRVEVVEQPDPPAATEPAAPPATPPAPSEPPLTPATPPPPPQPEATPPG